MERVNIESKLLNLLIGIFCFLAVALIVNGVNASVNENTIYVIKNINEYEKNVAQMENMVNELKKEVTQEKRNIAEFENDDYLDNVIILNKQIEELKFYNGFTAARGPGIMLSVSDSIIEDDSLDIMQKIVHDVDITVLLNDLKSAGAEAIDVNGQRIINISEVVCAGPLLHINGESVPAPFIIRAIGDMDNLYNSVNEEGTYAYDLKNTYGMKVAALRSFNLTIPRYRGNNHEINYANSIER